MSRFGFCGPTYQSQSVNADCQLTQNWYPEVDESGNGKSPLVMYPTPGTKAFAVGPDTTLPSVRGLYYSPSTNRFFAVCGKELWEVDATGSVTLLFSGLVDDGLPVTWAENSAQQLIFCAGNQLWCYPLAAGLKRTTTPETHAMASIAFVYSATNSLVTVTFTDFASSYQAGFNVTFDISTSQFQFLNGVPFTIVDAGPLFFTFYLGSGYGAVTSGITGNCTANGSVPFTGAVQVNDPTIPISFVDFIDGYFICTYANSSKFQISALEDGTSWDAADVGKVSEFPDIIRSMKVLQELVIFFGTTKSVPYYDSGDALFPFAPVPNVLIEQGIGPAHSRVQADNTVFWIGLDKLGSNIAWRANGYTPTRISTHAVEYAWSQYAAAGETTSNVIGYSYQDQGHTFVVWYFPSANGGLGATWVYDIATSMWHNRSHLSNGYTGLGLPNGSVAHLSRSYAFGFGKHLVGDWRSSTICEMSINIYDDFNTPYSPSDLPPNLGPATTEIQRIRRAPHVSIEQEFMRHNQLQVYLESGLATFYGYPTGPQTISLADAIGNNWNVQITNAGAISAAQVAGTSTDYIFQDVVQTTKFYQLFAVNATTLAAVLLIEIPVEWLMFLNMATLDGTLQTGISVQNGNVVVGTPTQAQLGPTANLRWSDDGGHSWSNYYSVDCGQLGDWKKRVIWRRLGRARDRVYELSMSDASPWRIVDAYLKATPGFQPQERLADQLRKVG